MQPRDFLLGDVLRVGDRRLRVVALDEATPDTRFCDGDGGEIIIAAPPHVTLPKTRPPRKRAA